MKPDSNSVPSAIHRPSSFHMLVGLAQVLAFGMGISLAAARDYVWELPGGGEWANASSWGESGDEFPNGVDVSVLISREITSPESIALPDREVTVGSLVLGLGDLERGIVGWSLAGKLPLILSSTDGAVKISMAGGVHSIEVPVQMHSDLEISGSGTLRLVISRNFGEVSGPKSLVVESGVLDLRVRSDRTGESTIRDGATIVAVRPSALGVGPVFVENGGTLVIAAEGAYLDNTIHVSGEGATGRGGLYLGADWVSLSTMREGGDLPKATFKSGGFSGEIVLGSDTAIGVMVEGMGEISGVISGTHLLSKVGPGTLVLASANSHAGTRVQNGILSVQAENALPPNAPLELQGGVLEISANQQIGALRVTGDSILRIMDGTSILSFADSSRVQWAEGKSLIIESQTKTPVKLNFAGGAQGLSAKQMKQIQIRLGERLVPIRLSPSGDLLVVQ